MKILLLIAVYVLKAVWLYIALSVVEPWAYALLAVALLIVSLGQAAVMTLIYRPARFELKRFLGTAVLSLSLPLIYMTIFVTPLPIELLSGFVCSIFGILSVAAVIAVCWLSCYVLSSDLRICIPKETKLHPAVRGTTIVLGIVALFNALFWLRFMAAALAAENFHAFIGLVFVYIANFLFEAVLTVVLAAAQLQSTKE